MESALCGESPSVCIGHGARDRMRIIEDFSLEQLIELNHLSANALLNYALNRDFDVLMQLRLGQQVHFESQRGPVFDV